MDFFYTKSNTPRTEYKIKNGETQKIGSLRVLRKRVKLLEDVYIFFWMKFPGPFKLSGKWDTYKHRKQVVSCHKCLVWMIMLSFINLIKFKFQLWNSKKKNKNKIFFELTKIIIGKTTTQNIQVWIIL